MPLREGHSHHQHTQALLPHGQWPSDVAMNKISRCIQAPISGKSKEALPKSAAWPFAVVSVRIQPSKLAQSCYQRCPCKLRKPVEHQALPGLVSTHQTTSGG